MTLDPRFYNLQMARPSSPSVYSGNSAMTSSASAVALRSDASSPSLRAKEGIVLPIVRQVSSPSQMQPGGNVRVVVRVRKFLPRGMSYSIYCNWYMNIN